MVDNPVDERVRPPDPTGGVEELNIDLAIHDTMDGSSSTSSRLREETIQVATIEADMDEVRYYGKTNRNLVGDSGEIQSVDNLQGLGRGESKGIGAEKVNELEAAKSSSMEAAKLHAIESAKLSSMAATTSSDTNQLDGSRHESGTGESSLGLNQHITHRGEDRRDRNIDSRQEIRVVESQNTLQAQGHRDDNQRSNLDNSTKEQHQQIATTNLSNPGSRTIVGYPIQNNQGDGSSSELLRKQGNNQGNTTITTSNFDEHVQEICRIQMEPVRTQHYHTNFPKISSNFDRNVNRKVIDKNDPPLANIDKSTKKDQPQEPAPYTVIQTYADRLRFNQSKKDVSIRLTEPEITTKKGLPAVLYVKDEVVNDMASTCKFTLIGKFIYTMPRVELIRKNLILQTQLLGGVKIAHFNSRHVYIDIDNELDYNMVWTKQRMTIAGQVMRIQAWTPNFKPEEETPLVPIWISLPELSWHCYNKEFITSLLSPIGRVLYLDSASINKTRGSQARVKV